MTKELNMNDVQEPIASAPPEVRRIIERVMNYPAASGRGIKVKKDLEKTQLLISV